MDRPDDSNPGVGARLTAAATASPVTFAVIVLNLAVWLANLATGVDPMAPLSADLIAWGANHRPFTLREPWRLLAATVLHAGLAHLAMNMWALWDTGRVAERFYGSLQFALIYLASGLFGSLASLFFAARTGVSIGASGAVFGVVGAVLAAVFTQHEKLPPALVRSMRASMMAFTAFSLFMGFTAAHIDNAAHIGGLLSGFVLGLLLVARFDAERFRRQALPRAVLALGVAVTTACGLWWVQSSLV